MLRLQMAKKQKKPNETGGKAKIPTPNGQTDGKAKRTVRMITAKDAGWITPTCFVLPLKLIPVDPPRPIKKAPPPAG